jgi:VCBS repeat protein
MKPTAPSVFVLALLWSGILPADAQVNVTQFHNHSSRDGLYVDSAFTPANAANLSRDLNFNGTISGQVYAQPLYIEGGPNGPMVIVVTELNNVYALDAVGGSIIWQRNLGNPVSAGNLPCPTVINTVGITGTPIVNLASRALFLDAMTTPDGGTTKKHYIFSLNVDTGVTNFGWPVDVGARASYNGTPFTAAMQLQRPALGIVGNTLYVPYGSFSDCGVYHGWLVGVPIGNPASVTAWATSAIGGAIWGVGGVASDGSNPFVTTGNTFNTGGNWGGGEAVIRFQPGPIFSGNPIDYWVPTNWLELDNVDKDLGGSGPLLVDVPGATPSALVVALGKDGNAYLVNRSNLGGITVPVASLHIADRIIGAPATYRTNQGTYVAFRAGPSTLASFRVTATSPPTINFPVWSVSQNGSGSPFATSTDGTNNMIVWAVGSQGDQRLHGYNGDTGVVVYSGGGANELMAGTHTYSTTGIAARGRIYVATDNKVYAFRLGGTIDCLTNPNTDFNHDGKPDYVLYNGGTRQTAVWHMNNNIFLGGVFAPTLPPGWNVIDVADFNGDGDLDYALFNPSTHRTAIWYLSGATFIGGAFGPTLPGGWTLVATADFNFDCHPDYVLYNASTRQIAIWYMKNNVFAGGAFGPTLPAGWSLAGVADFNRDGTTDYLLFNASTHRTAIWYLSGVTLVGGAFGPTLPSAWALVGVGDFNGDGRPDYVLYNASTRQTAIWYMNNTVFAGGAFGPTLPGAWSLVGP